MTTKLPLKTSVLRRELARVEPSRPRGSWRINQKQRALAAWQYAVALAAGDEVKIAWAHFDDFALDFKLQVPLDHQQCFVKCLMAFKLYTGLVHADDFQLSAARAPQNPGTPSVREALRLFNEVHALALRDGKDGGL